MHVDSNEMTTGVNVNIADSKVIVKGKLGELKFTLPAGISISQNENLLILERTYSASGTLYTLETLFRAEYHQGTTCISISCVSIPGKTSTTPGHAP